MFEHHVIVMSIISANIGILTRLDSRIDCGVYSGFDDGVSCGLDSGGCVWLAWVERYVVPVVDGALNGVGDKKFKKW